MKLYADDLLNKVDLFEKRVSRIEGMVIGIKKSDVNILLNVVYKGAQWQTCAEISTNKSTKRTILSLIGSYGGTTS